MGGVAAFIQNNACQLEMADFWGAVFHHLRTIIDHRVFTHCHQRTTGHLRPAPDAIHQFGQLCAALAFDQSHFNRQACTLKQGNAVFTGRHLNGLLCLIAQTTLWRVHDPLKREIIIGGGHNTEIGHRITDFQTFIEPWTANHTIRQTDGQEPILKGTHLVGCPNQNRHFI